MRTCSNPSVAKKPSIESFLMAGAEGFEPPEWLDQNQLPYHLATPQYGCFLACPPYYSIEHITLCQEIFYYIY